jgi:hypothetical protein
MDLKKFIEGKEKIGQNRRNKLKWILVAENKHTKMKKINLTNFLKRSINMKHIDYRYKFNVPKKKKQRYILT